jgi:hypothetical protein
MSVQVKSTALLTRCNGNKNEELEIGNEKGIGILQCKQNRKSV